MPAREGLDVTVMMTPDFCSIIRRAAIREVRK
jgi:hypothetical protein